MTGRIAICTDNNLSKDILTISIENESTKDNTKGEIDTSNLGAQEKVASYQETNIETTETKTESNREKRQGIKHETILVNTVENIPAGQSTRESLKTAKTTDAAPAGLVMTHQRVVDIATTSNAEAEAEAMSTEKNRPSHKLCQQNRQKSQRNNQKINSGAGKLPINRQLLGLNNNNQLKRRNKYSLIRLKLRKQSKLKNEMFCCVVRL
jgi:hypothetical protein